MTHLHVSKTEFDAIVAEALDELPDEFHQLLDNVVVVIEEEPSDDDLELCEEDDELLGIFRGGSLAERTFSSISDGPAQVAIFRGPILRVCESREEAIEEIRDTVIHELGHFFGLGDEEMEY